MLAVETATLGGQEVGGVGASRSRAKRMRADRGAVIVEYALVLALVLVPSFCTIQQLDKSSRTEVNHQANCIATRPPPPSCQPRSVTTLPPGWVIPTSTTTTQPPSTPSGTLSFLNPAVEDLPGGTWDAIVFASFQVAGDPVTPGVGATVRVRVTITAPANPTPFFIECVTTAPGGLCELRFTTPAPGVTALRFDFETLEGFDGIVTVNPAALPPPYTHP